MFDLKHYYEKAQEKCNLDETKRTEMEQGAQERVRSYCQQRANEVIEQMKTEAVRRAERGKPNDEYYASLDFDYIKYRDKKRLGKYNICSAYIGILHDTLNSSGITNAKVHSNWIYQWLNDSSELCYATIKVKRWTFW